MSDDDTPGDSESSDDRAEQFMLVNPLPWDRQISGSVSKYAVAQRGEMGDETSARHWHDRTINDSKYRLPPTEVPGFGFRICYRDRLVECEDSFDERPIVETDRYQVRFDRERGGIASLYDRKRDRELVDQHADYPLAGFVYERLAEQDLDSPRERFFRAPPADNHNINGLWNAAPELVEELREELIDEPEPEWGYQSGWFAERCAPERVTCHRVYDTPVGTVVRQHLAVDALDSMVELMVRFPDESDEIVVEVEWKQGQTTYPESTYLAFPFAVEDATARIDVGEQAIQPGRDQLSGTNHDSYNVQRWVDFANDDHGVTVACPLTPMVQLGDFHFGDARDSFELDRAMLLSWVTTNYYNTNFRANQPGRVRARYHVSPHDGFDEAHAHRVGRAAEHIDPITQPLTEPRADDPFETAGQTGQLLDLPEPPILVTSIQPDGDGTLSPFPGGDDSAVPGSLIVLLLNASDEPRTAIIDSGLLNIESGEAAQRAGASNPSVEVIKGEARVMLNARELGAVRLHFE
ncbi:hypothetical protein [Haloprofundus salilacus]|uniref:hypothetical protein n=1 Tax=Haloprofundus salilacus TaxID=2876190 RepID=UPI001CCAAEA8|nr:hypothetical protein [Haloprofundus salilacus]